MGNTTTTTTKRKKEKEKEEVVLSVETYVRTKMSAEDCVTLVQDAMETGAC